MLQGPRAQAGLSHLGHRDDMSHLGHPGGFPTGSYRACRVPLSSHLGVGSRALLGYLTSLYGPVM
jgi:hypothetical protein